MDSRFTRWRALFIAQQFRDPALTAQVVISGSASVSFAVPASSASGVERGRGSGAESFSVAAFSGSGTEREIGSGSTSFAVPSLSDSGDERERGTGSTSFGVPSIEGAGTAGIPADSGAGTVSIVGPAFSGSGSQHVGGGGSRYTVSARRFVVEKLPKLEIIAGAGRSEISRPAVAGSANQAFAAAGFVLVGVPDLQASGFPVISGRGTTAHRHIFAGIGVHDITPVEEEEYALLMAA